MNKELAANTTILHYRVISKIGEGGMGEVYLAEDTELGRQVALKILLSEVAGDEDRVRRFVQEAKAASALNHPNILTVYQIGMYEDSRFIATELIKGETLRDRLRGEPLTMREVLDVAMQIAAALNAAHNAGIVHRDIKPENIMLRDDGFVKVLDFGLAKLAKDPAATTDSEDATVAQVKTRPGMIMGTVQYMSPEQARGKETDARCDVWSLGIVIYEMLTKVTPFAGETANDSIAAILTKDPPPLDTSTPSELQRIIRKSLQKNADERYQTIKDMLLDVKNLKRELEISDELERSQVPHATGSSNVGTAQMAENATVIHSRALSTQNSLPQQRSSAEYIVSEIKSHKFAFAGVAIFVLLAIGAVFGIYKFSGTGAGGSAKKEFSLADATITKLTTNGKATFAAISPDGKYVAHIQLDGVETSIYLRQVATQSNVQIVPPNETAFLSQVTFSPDGNYVYYDRNTSDSPVLSLYRVPTLGGEPKKILDDLFRVVAFSPDGGRIAFSRKVNDSFQLLTANADGSNVEKVLDTNTKEGLDNIIWSPDGKKIIYEIFKFELWENKDSGTTTFFEIQLADHSTRKFSGKDWAHIFALSWSPDGRSLLMVASEKKEPTQIWQISYPDGTAKRLTNDPDGYGTMSASADLSTLAVVKSISTSSLWVAPAGDPGLVRPVTSGAGKADDSPSWSPDGKIFFYSVSGTKGDIWSVNVDGSGLKQITSTQEFEQSPTVSPDGRYVAYVIYSGSAQVWLINSDGSGPRQMTKAGTGDWFTPTFSPDGRWLYCSENSDNKFTLWKIAVDGSGEPVKVAEKSIPGILISPDGKQMAYFNLEAKPPQIEIAPIEVFTPVKTFVPCPTCGGGQWSPDGRSLVYIDTSKDGVGNLWAQPIAGGQPKKLTNFTSERIINFAYSRDGKQIAYSRGTQTSDVLLYTNIK